LKKLSHTCIYKKFGRSVCCNNPVPPDCINGNFPEFEKYNFTYIRTSNTALGWMEIKNQLYNLKKTIAFSWKYLGNGGHMMVITGYTTIDGVNCLYIIDPLEVNKLKKCSFASVNSLFLIAV